MTPASPAVRLARRLHRIALAAHPRAFREEFGDELDEGFVLEAERVMRARGALRLVAYTLRACLDALRVSLTDRGSLRVGSSGERWRRHEDRGGGEVMRTMGQDLVVGVRMLVRRPVFAAAAIGTLALGIGANTAIFSVVDAVLLRPLPFPEPGQLVRLYHGNSRSGNERGTFSVPDREDWVARSTSLSHVAVYSDLPSGLLLTGGDEPVEVRTAYVSAGFFGALGREALLGRVLRDDEEHGDNRVVVLSHGFWQRRFGSDVSIVGRRIQLDDTGFTVAGVMPPDFGFPRADVEVWAFLSIIPSQSIPLEVRQLRFLDAVGRVRSGTSVGEARSELTAVAASLAADYPDDNESLDRAVVVPLRESMTGDVRTTLLVLLGAVALVLLIACANVANLLLSRALERDRELEIRRALGGGRSRLVRQLLTETLALGVAGGVLGVGLAYLATDALIGGVEGLLPRAEEIGIDTGVLTFSLALTALAALASGVLPALKATSGVGRSGLSSSRSTTRSRGASRTWGVLVAAQVGLAMVIVIGSGLLMRSLMALQSVDAGLDTDRLVALSLTINDARYPERPAYQAAYERLLDHLEAIPGVESVASIRFLPLRRDGESTELRLPEGESRTGQPLRASLLQVSPGFFETAGVPLLGGREFTSRDGADTPPVLIVNEAFRRLHWPDRLPVGEVLLGPGGGQAEIVGVVGDVRQRGLAEEVGPTVYAPQAQNPRRGMAFVLRTAGDPGALLPAVRAAVQEADPDQPIEQLAAMRDVVSGSTSRPRFFTALLGGFALLALLLASLGIYGVVSHAVSRRVAEIGIRVALGAPRVGVLGLVVAGGMRPVLAGAAIGLLLAFPTMRLLDGVLYAVDAADPVTFLVMPLVLVGVGLLACWLPAARATRIDPTEALRAE